MRIDLKKRYDVFGIGNAIMDFLVEVEPDVLIKCNMEKGQCRGVDDEELQNIFKSIGEDNFKRIPGGSAANILSGIAKMGGKVVFCGKIGSGEQGLYYEQTMFMGGVKPRLSKTNLKTGKAITFITPDSERSFAANLGAAVELRKEDIFEDDIKESKIVHMEGYHLQNSDLLETAMYAIDIAKQNGILVSLDLNDAGMVARNLDSVRKFVKNHIDILFANEQEAEAFTGKSDPIEALEILSSITKIAIVKNGPKGSFIRHNNITFNIPPFEAKAIDTTGAGDMYAAGFLHGLCQGLPLEQCGRLGSFAASRVVEQVGARYEGDLKAEIKQALK
ncbi:MAG: adenosine kinase [Nanoarchaeota archaeon]|nr:adenosine kinase [Nanoarchaeota archaeon]